MNESPRHARKIAEQILFLRSKLRLQTTPLEVIKLVYISHGWMLGIYNRALSLEPAEAWIYGPVIPEVYHSYKSFRGTPIDEQRVDRTKSFDPEQQVLINEVVRQYQDYSGVQLSSITHRVGTPWYRVYRGGRGLGAIIPNRIISKYYRRLSQSR